MGLVKKGLKTEKPERRGSAWARIFQSPAPRNILVIAYDGRQYVGGEHGEWRIKHGA